MAGDTTLTLGGTRRCLELRIAGSDETYRIPLMTQLKLSEFKEFSKAIKDVRDGADGVAYIDLFCSFASAYVPEDVLGELSFADLSTLATQWATAGGDGGKS